MAIWPWRKKRANVDEYGRNALWHHAADGNYEALDAELRCADSPSAADQDGFTTLHVAAQNGHLEIVRRLIAAHAEVNAVDRRGNGPLWTASRQASLAIAAEPSFEIVALLLSNGADPHHLNNAGRSPSFWAVGSSRLRETYTIAAVPFLAG
ncbi:ankyrin repeat domain-containing protein [Agrobacterium rosae]|uniref:ankyrin repeat domain-containing protein n=1 Tax=Agrobacterium rosae TaxID=1972867 RepID=UPI0019D3E19C|nr:ankyrin repeat domain-containing protein [Agrobacterium rosae]MBN7805643.1 ankyrin repeat domain-containing protein [Agrobacterium rosae]